MDEQLIATPSEQLIPPTPSKRKFSWWLFLLILVILLIGIGIIYKSRQAHPINKVGLSSQDTPTPQPMTSAKLGKLVLKKADDLYLYDEDTKSMEQLTATKAVGNYYLNRTKSYIYYLQNGEIYKLALATHIETQLTHQDHTVISFLFSPNEELIALETRTNEMPLIIKLDGSNFLNLTQLSIPENLSNQISYSQFSAVVWEPDSKHLIIRGHGQLDTTDNYLEVDIKNQTLKQFDFYGRYDINNMPEPFYSPDGKYLLYAVGYSPTKVYLTSTSHFQPRVIYTSQESVAWLTWAPDSTKIAVQEALYQKGKGLSLIVFDLTGKTIYTATSNQKTQAYMSFAWSANSRFVAAIQDQGYESKTPDKVVVIDTANASLKELTTEMLDPEKERILKIIFAPSNILYYDIQEDNTTVKDKTLPQVWAWDFDKNFNMKIANFTSLNGISQF